MLGDWSKPVLTADNNTWEVDAVQEPQVIYLPELKLLRMWYRGAGWAAPSGVGVADSFDGGKTWTKHGANPVWVGGDGSDAARFGLTLVFQNDFFLVVSQSGPRAQAHNTHVHATRDRPAPPRGDARPPARGARVLFTHVHTVWLSLHGRPGRRGRHARPGWALSRADALCERRVAHLRGADWA